MTALQYGMNDRGAMCVKTMDTVLSGAQIPAHSGQSSLGMDFSPESPWFVDAIFMASMAAQCGAAEVDLTNGDAMATPTKSANHTSTKRVIRWALRRTCI